MHIPNRRHLVLEPQRNVIDREPTPSETAAKHTSAAATPTKEQHESLANQSPVASHMTQPISAQQARVGSPVAGSPGTGTESGKLPLLHSA